MSALPSLTDVLHREKSLATIAIIPVGLASLCPQCDTVVNVNPCPQCGSQTAPLAPIVNAERFPAPDVSISNALRDVDFGMIELG